VDHLRRGDARLGSHRHGHHDAMNNHLRTLRESQGWTQGMLADQLGVSRQTVNALETGRYDPSLPLAFRIARLFARPIEAIFAPDENTQVPMDLNDAHGGVR
jgi:putative transcriptional regulator